LLLFFQKMIRDKPSQTEELDVARKSALDRIDNHEKICRLMQRQTFDQIKEIKDRILRLEKMLMAAGGAIILALIANMM